MYNNEEDVVYVRGVSDFYKYKHGNVYDVDASVLYNTTGDKRFYYPWIPDGDAAVVYNFDDRSYSYYEFNNSTLHYRHKSQYEMQLRKNGISWFKDLYENNMFLTKDLFGIGLTENECTMVKGAYFGTADIIDYAYME